MSFTQTNFPSFTPSLEGAPLEGLTTPTVDQKHRLGMRYQDGFGRVYRYCRAGATQLEVALMCSCEAAHANILNQAQTAYTTTAGDERITVLVTTGSGITDGQLADGWLTTRNGAGEGYTYGIANNTYITSDTVISLDLYDSIQIATAATSDLDIRKSLYDLVIVNATTPTGLPVGVPAAVIAINYYGWLQTKGPCAMTVDGGETLTIGCMCGGAATPATAGGVGVCAVTEPFYGQVINVAEADEQALINLMLE